ncbi:MAG TPA: BrnT family toxin [Thermoanaerobaculia bacterium]|nr:BrnT family toxin [Thermoanaerobaculia bacterium]
MITYRFEWDDAKALENEGKHGVSFGEAKTVFGDVHALHMYDGEHSWSEDRFIIIGRSERERLLYVVYVERSEVTLRLVSARRATARETRTYEEKASF